MRVLVCVYVDDFLYSGTDGFVEFITCALKSKFIIGSENKMPMTFTGIELKDSGNSLEMSQTD